MFTEDRSKQEASDQGKVETRRSLTGLIAGFVAIAAIMSIVILLGISRMAVMQQRMEEVVDNHLSKIRLVNDMRIAARERTLALYRMINQRDYFDRHESWLRFNENATEFSSARTALLDLSLSPTEKEILEDQARWTHKTVPYQDQVVDLIMDNQPAAANQVLLRHAVPSQDKVLDNLDRLSAVQEQLAQKATQQTLSQYQTTRTLLIILAIAGFSISGMIAAAVIRRTRETESRLHTEKQKAQVTLYSIAEGVITTDHEGKIESLNAAAKRITGCSGQEAKGKYLNEILETLEDTEVNAIDQLVNTAIAEGGVHTVSCEVRFTLRGSQEHVVEASAAPIRDEALAIIGAVLIFRDITEMHALSNELRIHASHDSLTGLLNRREFETRLADLIHDARENNSEHALCYLDLDMFKVVNDTCGHSAGDELLRQLSSELTLRTRKSDVIARLGGDEFGILLAHCSLDLARDICESIRVRIKENRFVWEDNSFEIGVSIGIVPITSSVGNAQEVLRAVDIAVYEAKDRGRNRVCVHQPEDSSVVQRQGEISWIRNINSALEQDRFVLYCQEIKPLQENMGEKPHFELLIRMIDVDGNIVEPMAFLPAAERFHLMPVIDRWVIHRAFVDLARLRVENRQLGQFNINLSGQSLSDEDLLSYIRAELALSGTSANDICFEITETAAIANLTAATQLIDDLRKLGFRFALDDFGSGLSSFGYLKTLKVDFLKIDGTFIRDISTDTADHAMVRSINQVAHVMGIKTVAEYIENEDIHIMATGIGIDYGQGIHIGLPLPLSHLAKEVPGRNKLRIVK